MDVAVVGKLLGAEGARLLEELGTTYDGTNALVLSERLQRRYDAALVAAALTQVQLRRRAAAKFGADAAIMFFTSDGLQQATHPVVAQRRTTRMAEADVRRLLDLGCGVGSDLAAFARAGIDVTAVERDEVTVALARANLGALRLRATVRLGDAAGWGREGFDAVFTDPARRGPKGRLFDPRAFSPPWSTAEELLQADAVVKTAPGIPHELVPAGVEAEWVSLDGRLREAALWSGRLARSRRRASVLTGTGGEAVLTDEDDAGQSAVRPVGRYVYEPDDAVIRAHLVTAVTAACHGWLLDPHLGYVSSDTLLSLPYARGYEVLDVLPYREKQLRAALRARDVGAVTIKKRGVAVTPEALRRRLALTGSAHATVILTRTPRSAVALLVEPHPPCG